MSERTYNILFLCTGNSARSIMAEAILNRVGHGKFNAFSAGSHPSGKINPLTLELLRALDYDTSGFRSKSWNEFATSGGRHFDFIFTVCDDAAGEACPVWPGKPITAHWGVPDPAAVTGSSVKKTRAFREAYRLLLRRIELFAALPLHSLDELLLQAKLRDIGTVGRADATSPVSE